MEKKSKCFGNFGGGSSQNILFECSACDDKVRKECSKASAIKRKMDMLPNEICVGGVAGRRFKSSRYYSGVDNMSVLDVTYRFNLKELVKAGVAKLYPLPDQKEKEAE